MKNFFYLIILFAFSFAFQSFTITEDSPNWIYDEGSGSWIDDGDYNTVLQVTENGDIHEWDYDCEDGYSYVGGPY